MRLSGKEVARIRAELKETRAELREMRRDRDDALAGWIDLGSDGLDNLLRTIEEYKEWERWAVRKLREYDA